MNIFIVQSIQARISSNQHELARDSFVSARISSKQFESARISSNQLEPARIQLFIT